MTPQIQLNIWLFLSAATLSLGLVPVARWLARRYHILDHPNSALKSHESPMPRSGGAGALVSFLIVIGIYAAIAGKLPIAWPVIAGLLVIMIVGLIDDVRGLTPNTRLIVHSLVALGMVGFGLYVSVTGHPSIDVPLTLFWIVGVTNALNIIDIMDGLAGGITFFASLGFVLLVGVGTESQANVIAVVLAGVTLGFLKYNFTAASIFMGDCGSTSLGFLLAVIGILVVKDHLTGGFGTSLVPVLVLAVPIYDTIFVSIMRWRKGMSPFHGSRDHIFLRMEHLGLDRLRIVIYAYVITIVFSLAAFSLAEVSNRAALAFLSAIAAGALIGGHLLALIRVETPREKAEHRDDQLRVLPRR